jgi:uncharacterized glyoxalase superfamily protein PhnB
MANPRAESFECCPYLFYDDVARAIQFLRDAFGLEERFVDRDEAGTAQHAQLGYRSGVVMLGATGAHAGYRPRKSPQALGGLNGGVYLFVDDVDRHARQAEAAGAKILMPPADMHWGDRLYCAEDPEGQFWMFATRMREVGAEER